MAATKASKELIWLNNFLEELGKKQPDSPLYCDNQSAIHLGKNPVLHGKTKHIQLRYHFIRGLISDGTLMLEKIRGTENPADMLTKVVTLDKLKLCVASTGLQGETYRRPSAKKKEHSSKDKEEPPHRRGPHRDQRQQPEPPDADVLFTDARWKLVEEGGGRLQEAVEDWRVVDDYSRWRRVVMVGR
ncbi:hypothetical protein E3N88_18884 [Mikania micrantha]|uniref:Reverse transcriptase Ty1/copia-type domain-containing protein n=1 Tax=Mikania micrantha TaxID=192012 RepID=A0A5N6NPC7_9ASTR|nr:hypothetical protein E3N88_18884 [Mikania micrantha]